LFCASALPKTVSLDSESWRQAHEWFDRLVDLPVAQRFDNLNELALPVPVRERLERLLEANELPGILDCPITAELFNQSSEEENDALIGKVIGHYRLESLLGRGGMSSVYRAFRADGAYDAPVAFKLLGSAFSGGTWRERFRRETAWLADLRHPGIAALLDAGTMQDGTPYLVTELIDGKPIDQWCLDRRADIRTRVALMIELCDAVAFAQKRLIIHRDIKAGNVLVTQEGQVKLLDFGIARPLSGTDEDPDGSPMTRLFTPEYAAPEQFSGEAVSTATDVFSLGVLLYRLLTGEMPFAGHEVASGLPQTADPPSRRITLSGHLSVDERRSHRRQLRGGLDVVAGKALEFDPARRYENAASLASDLRNWLAHRPLFARSPSLGYRIGLFVRRRTSLALALAGLAVVLAGGVAATVWQALEARNQAQEALAASARAEAVGEFLISLFDASDPDRVGLEPPSARTLLDGGLQRIHSELGQDPQIRRALLLAMARIYQKLGEPDAAGQALEQSGALGSENPPERAQAFLLKALIAYELSDPQAALAAIDNALAQASENIPAELQLSLMQSRARYLRATGNGAEAVETGLALLERLERQDSPNPDLHLAVLTDLTGLMSGEGHYYEAVAFSDQAMALIEAGHGVPTAHFNALANRSHVLQQLGRLAESVDYQRRALALAEKTYGSGHRRLASLNGNLANRLQSLGAWQEAEQRFRRALELFGNLSPEPNIRSAAVHNNYSVLLYNAERYAEALEHATVAAALATETFGPEDSRTLACRFNVANSMSWLGHPEAAGQMIELLELRRQRAEEFPVAVAGVMGALADHYRRFGQLDLALDMAKQASEIVRKQLHQPHHDLIGPLVGYAQVLAELDRHDQAGKQFATANALAMELGDNAGFAALRMVDRYSEWLVEHDPTAARQLLRDWMESETAQVAMESPLLARLQARLVKLD
jgi:eukaryotic-like serine/threonine-protein kinase